MTASPSDPAGIRVSEELRAPVSTGIELCYQTYGEQSADPLLLVMGLSAPMTWWSDEFCRRLATAGFFVVRFDNRDVGRSGRGQGRVTRADLVRAGLGLPGRPPYTLSEMADDMVGLLDHLGIEKAHIVGASMGGMLCATCRVPGSASPAAETIALLGALLAGDWSAVATSDERARREASGVVAAYLAWHLERGLRSLAHVDR